MIHILGSYKLNKVITETATWQNDMAAEVIEVGRRALRHEPLDELLLKVVDATMKQVFTEAGAEVIYNYLENNSHLKKKELCWKPEVFSTGMKKLLGSGASVIEKLILKNLYRKLELKFEAKKGYEFSDYIKELRKKCDCQNMSTCKVPSKILHRRGNARVCRQIS